MWSYVGAKAHPRWLWWGEDRASGHILAYVFGRRTHATFPALRRVPARAGRAVCHWFTDAWWAYVDELPAHQRTESKAGLQALERKHLTVRTRIKRLTRKTICCSQKLFFHEGVSALFIHHFFFLAPQYY